MGRVSGRAGRTRPTVCPDLLVVGVICPTTAQQRCARAQRSSPGFGSTKFDDRRHWDDGKYFLTFPYPPFPVQ